jgi:hypothetical protein
MPINTEIFRHALQAMIFHCLQSSCGYHGHKNAGSKSNQSQVQISRIESAAGA